MSYNIKYTFDEESGSSLCLLETKHDGTFIGTAQCREEDRDMINEKTGCEIAYRRAKIKYVENKRDKLANELAGLKKYYFTVCKSKYYNPDGYMETMLKKQIEMREEDLDYIKDTLAEYKYSLKDYMKRKGDFYDKIRKTRKAKLNQAD